MDIESIIEPVPEPIYCPVLDIVDPAEWLAALRSDAVKIEIGAVFLEGAKKGWKTQPRDANNRYDTHYLFHCPSAGLIVRTTDGIDSLTAGTLAWFPPGNPYSLALTETERRHVVHRFRFKVLRGEALLSPFTNAAFFPDCDWISELVNAVHSELNVPEISADEQFRAMLIQLSLCALRHNYNLVNESKLTPGRLKRLHGYMVGRIANRPSPSDLASVAGLSPTYFAKVFHEATGVSPRRWIVQQRVRHAADLLLETSMNVSEIAYYLGYEEPRLFTRQFPSEFGMSPRKYRNERG